MKVPNPRPILPGALLLSAALASTLIPRAAAQTAGYASQVISYVPGAGVSSAYTANPAAALGKPGGNVGSGTLNPFSPNFAASELTGIGMGGELTIELSNFVTVGAAGTREIGVFGNAGLINVGATGAPAAGSPAAAFGVRSVLVSVSADGVNFVPLNGGNLLTSTLPANFYTNADTTNVNAPPPANPTLADFGKPFMGSLADFNGQTYAQILATLGGSAGGTWLDLSGTGLSRVAFVQFSEPATGGANGGVFYLNGVSSNENLLGAAVPEPSALALAGVLAALGLLWRIRLRLRRGAAVACCAALGWAAFAGTASAQMFSFADIHNWTGTGSNEAAMVVDWHDGKTPESIAFGYRWDGNATGMQMLQAIQGGNPRLFYSTAYGGDFVYSFGYNLGASGGTFTPGTPGAGTETGSGSNPADHYAEGVFTKFWGYDTSEGSPYGGGGAWSTYPDSAGNRPLANGSWDGWRLSFDETNFTVPDPGLPASAAAVPEPAAGWAVALGLGVVVLVKRRGAGRTLPT